MIFLLPYCKKINNIYIHIYMYIRLYKKFCQKLGFFLELQQTLLCIENNIELQNWSIFFSQVYQTFPSDQCLQSYNKVQATEPNKIIIREIETTVSMGDHLKVDSKRKSAKKTSPTAKLSPRKVHQCDFAVH